MSDPNYIADFFKKCVSEGRNTPEEICGYANQLIQNIDESLQKMNDLRQEKTYLQGIIKQLGFNKTKHEDKCQLDSTLSKDKLGKYWLDLCVRICDFIEQNPGVRPSKIMTNIGSYDEQKSIYSVIKWLGYNSIIDRDENRGLIKGSSWDDRPKKNDTN